VAAVPRTTEATTRDALALQWIAEQYTVRADVAAVLLGRLSPAEPREPGRVGLRTVRHHVQRWERLRFAERRWLRGCCWIMPTRRGLAAAGVRLPVYEPVAYRLAHTHAVAVVRLAIEGELPEVRWTSERLLRVERGDQKRDGQRPDRERPRLWWLPDGFAEVDEQAATVEVELSPKKLVDLKEAATSIQYPRARGRLYYAPVHRVDTLRTHLAGLRVEVEGASRGAPWLATEVYPLPVLPGVSYGMPDQPARWAG
jgi:hypothetical protein